MNYKNNKISTENYFNLTMTTPNCIIGEPQWAIEFEIYEDVSHLFPYINSLYPDSRYFDNPHYIRFSMDERYCVLYPKSSIIKPFNDKNEALKFINHFFSVLNSINNKKDTLTLCHKTFEHVPVLEIYNRLPGTNCKNCGYESCMAFSNAVSSGETNFVNCSELKNN